jgi:hypothetical protein
LHVGKLSRRNRQNEALIEHGHVIVTNKIVGGLECIGLVAELLRRVVVYNRVVLEHRVFAVMVESIGNDTEFLPFGLDAPIKPKGIATLYTRIVERLTTMPHWATREDLQIMC